MSTKIKIPKRHKSTSLDAKKSRAGYAFVAPFLIGVILVYLPILLDSIWFSFYERESTGTLINHGFEYYKKALALDSAFISKLLDALAELVFQVPAIIIFSLFIAVVLNQKMLGRAVFRAIFFVPVIIATGLMESINVQDKLTGENMEGGSSDGSEINNSSNQLISTMDVEALFRMMKFGGELVDVVVELVNGIYDIVNYSGVQMLIFLAGLQSISPAIYEACRIDGATGWETFWKVTFPMISPMILVNTVYTIIDSFTRSKSVMMEYLTTLEGTDARQSAESWLYFIAVILILAVVAGIASSFIFYQKRD